MDSVPGGLSALLAATLLLGCTHSSGAPGTRYGGAGSRAARGRTAAGGPSSVIRIFYVAINRRSYRHAYSYLAAAGRPAYAEWVKGYRGTQRVTISRLRPARYRIPTAGGTYTCLGTQLSAIRGGNKTNFGGWYAMQKMGGSGWRIDLKGSRIAYHGVARPPSRRTCLAAVRK